MKTIKTTVHTYRFDISKPEEKQAYETLVKGLPKDRKFETGSLVLHNRKYGLPIDFANYNNIKTSFEVEIDTTHIFNNQLNTSDNGNIPNARIFDWYEEIFPNKNIKQGHYTVITPELHELRMNTYACGFCGKQEPAAKGYVFCPHCINSPYLKKSNLYLLRMGSVSQSSSNRPPLTSAEQEHLLSIWNEAQQENIHKMKVKIQKKRKEAIHAAHTEADGFLWLLDNGWYSLDNVIYYKHDDQFCFGWRQPLEQNEIDEFLKIASEFPFSYKLKGKDRDWESY